MRYVYTPLDLFRINISSRPISLQIDIDMYSVYILVEILPHGFSVDHEGIPYPNTARLFQSALTTPAELKSVSVRQLGLVIQCYSSTLDRSICTLCNCCSEAQFHMHTTTWLPDPMCICVYLNGSMYIWIMIAVPWSTRVIYTI